MFIVFVAFVVFVVLLGAHRCVTYRRFLKRNELNKPNKPMNTILRPGYQAGCKSQRCVPLWTDSYGKSKTA